MSNAGLFHWQEKFGKTNPHVITLVFQITGAGTSSAVPQGTPVLSTYGAIASQSIIDDFLGTTNEFLVAAFDVTAMGADTFACIVNMQGQAAKLLYATGEVYSGTDYVARASVDSGLTASTIETAADCGDNGNIAVKFNFGNSPDFDGLTTGVIAVKLYWVAK